MYKKISRNLLYLFLYILKCDPTMQKIEILFSVQSKFIIMARKRKNRRKVGAKLARKLKKDKRQKNMERWRIHMKAKEMTDLIRDFTQLLEVSPLPGTFAALQEKSAK